MTEYIERAEVQKILSGVLEEHVHIAEGFRADVDQLPTAEVPKEWVDFYQKYKPTNQELEEIIRRLRENQKG